MAHSKSPESLLPKPAHPRFFRCNLMLNDQVMKFNANQPIECNPIKAIGLNSYFLTMRHELHSLGNLSLQDRREKMKKRLIEDFLQEEKEMSEVELGYIDTQP